DRQQSYLLCYETLISASVKVWYEAVEQTSYCLHTLATYSFQSRSSAIALNFIHPFVVSNLTLILVSPKACHIPYEVHTGHRGFLRYQRPSLSVYRISIVSDFGITHT